MADGEPLIPIDQQLAAQAAAFEKEGGFAEPLYRVRSQGRRKSSSPKSSSQ